MAHFGRLTCAGVVMICNRCEQWIPENSRSPAKGYCKHCRQALLQKLQVIDG